MFLTPTLLFRRTCIEKTGLMVPQMRRNQDGEFLLRLLYNFRLAVIPEPHVVCHLAIRPTKHYDAVSVSLPYRLRHVRDIRTALGFWPALYYASRMRTNLLVVAVREGRWPKARRDLWRRLSVCPVLFPAEVIMLVKAFMARTLYANRS